MEILKNKILNYKIQNPSLGNKKIAKALGCDQSTVRYHINDNYRKRHNKKRIDRRRDKKRILVEENGGKCCKCGYNKCVAALDFHHLDPKIKDNKLKFLTDVSLKSAREEVKKCILVCANCHREIHANDFYCSKV